MYKRQGKEHLERNDFIIEKQKAELQRIDETKRYKEQQVSLAEKELKQVKSEIRTDKLKSVATDAVSYTHLDVYKRQVTDEVLKLNNGQFTQELTAQIQSADCLLYTSRCV